MRLALVGPSIMPIPPDGWGAVESLIWDYALELDELGHDGTIVKTHDWDQIINFLNEEQYDFALSSYIKSFTLSWIGSLMKLIFLS